MNEKALPRDVHGVHIHFVGIKGTGMAALVEILYGRGAVITGSDVSETFYTDAILEKLGISALPFAKENITASVQYVIYSSAYSVTENPDLQEAKSRNIPLFLYSEALGQISTMAFSAGICGVHGKTTTTGMVGTLLKHLPLSSQTLAGSVISSFENSCTVQTGEDFTKIPPDKKTYFVAETCEYKRNFMYFHPKKIILTAVESDHQDFYPTYKDIRKAFVDYVCLLPYNGQLIYCADQDGAIEVAGLVKQLRPDIDLIPYGKNAYGAYKLEFGRIEHGKQYFTVQALGECAIAVPGIHNVRNANAALALCAELLKTDGKNPKEYSQALKAGLLEYAGGKRRSEIIARTKTPRGQELVIIDDYGHHPTAIKSTLEGYRKFYKGHKIIVDFMSHTYSRTAALLADFAASFGAADEVIINKIYASAREDAEMQGKKLKVTGKTLAVRTSERHKHVTYCEEFDEAAQAILSLLKEESGPDYPDGWLFVTMGAGDNWKVGQKVLAELGEQYE